MSHVLIVEDHEETRRAIADFVHENGLDATVAGTLREAREALAHEQPLLAVIDIGLPDGNGLELVDDAIAACGTRVALMTGDARLDTAIAGFRAGAVDYFEKPIAYERFADLLRKCKENVSEAVIAPAGLSAAPVDEDKSARADAVVLPVGTTLSDACRELIHLTLREYDGDKRRAAQTLGICVKTLYNHLNRERAASCPAD